MTRRFFAALAAGLVTAAIATPADAAPKRCDPLGGGECLLPFPNDYFTKKDRRTETGRRLALPRAGMPANKDGVRIDPRDWNRADGFSPGQQITALPEGPEHRARRQAQQARPDHGHRTVAGPQAARRPDRRRDG